MLTGFPCKQIKWAEVEGMIQELSDKIWKDFTKYSSSQQIRIAYLRPKVAKEKNIPENFPFLILEHESTDDPIHNVQNFINKIL